MSLYRNLYYTLPTEHYFYVHSGQTLARLTGVTRKCSKFANGICKLVPEVI